MKRILVTGGNGVIGTALCEELKRRGYCVISADLFHRHDEAGYFIREGPETSLCCYARCDVSEYRQVERLVFKYSPLDLVYHAAAEFGRWNGEDFYENLWRTNVIGTKNILRMQEQEGFNLIHFSSSEVYGDWPDLMVETVMDTHEVKQLNDYAMTKWVNEMQIRNSALADSTKTVIVRLFNTYGPGEYYSPYRSVVCRFLYRALAGLPFTVFRHHRRTATFLPDTIRTLANIVDNFKPGETYNIGGDGEHSIEELAELVLKVTGADKSLAQYTGPEAMTTLVKSVDVSKSVRDLGHKNTVGLEEGLRLTAEWMRKVYAL